MFAVNFRLESSLSRSGSGPCTIHLTCVHSNDPPRLSRKKQLGIIILKLISHFNGNGEIIQTLFFRRVLRRSRKECQPKGRRLVKCKVNQKKKENRAKSRRLAGGKGESLIILYGINILYLTCCYCCCNL